MRYYSMAMPASVSKTMKKILLSSCYFPLRFSQHIQLHHLGVSNGSTRLQLKSQKESDDIISSYLGGNDPFMITRYGSVEFEAFTKRSGFNSLYTNAGFFPNDEGLLDEFINVYERASTSIDVLGIWIYKYKGYDHWFKKMGLIKRLPNIQHLITMHSLNPYTSSWVKHLEGKNVLVVHPFEESIIYQYDRRDDVSIIPNFKSLQVIKAVQTIADNADSRFKNWFEALEYMKEEISSRDFDVCLIGCGAYGLPLAAHVKSIGRQAIHVGGALQLLFGIKGKRWEVEYNYKFDENWIYPLDIDTPKGNESVENSCYWK